VQDTTGLLAPYGWGLGYPDWVDVPQPSAGANASVLVDGTNIVRVLAARARLTTSATVANRFVSLDYVDARSNVRASSGASVAVPASQTNVQHEWDYNRAAGSSGAGAQTSSPLLFTFLPPGFTIRFTVLNIDGTDQLSSLSLWVERFNTGPRGEPTGMVTALEEARGALGLPDR
jgi:hypothetical protein